MTGPAQWFGRQYGARRLGFAAAAGGLMALAQSPVSWPFALFLALPVLLWLLDGTTGPGAAFGVGWAAGVGFFAGTLFWIVDPFLVDAATFGWMAPFALVGMAAGLAMFWAAPFAAARTLWRQTPVRVLLLAALWTLSEYARGEILTGFPWALPAYTWVETPVIQAVALIGPHGLGFLTLLTGLLPGLLTWPALIAAALLVTAGWGFGAAELARPVPARDPALMVRLVQPNAAQEMKWDPEKQMGYFERHLAETRAPALRSPDVTIWSETAAPFALGYAEDLQSEAAASVGPEGRLITGIRRVVADPNGEHWYNSLAVLRGDGTVQAVYDKHHLVPFGEYIPLAGLVGGLGLPAIATLTRTGFSAGDGPHLVAPPGLPPFLPLICYEAIFPDALRAPEGRGEWLVQITNDAWFGQASGPYQHFAQARVRAIEQGLPLARAANTGISAMIDPRGRVVASLGLGVEGHLDALLPAALSPTLYARFGDRPVLIGLVFILGLTFLNFYGGVFFKARR